MSRTENALRNTKYGLISKILNLILGFVSRTVFIYTLGTTYLGVNGLFTEVLSILSLTDLGMGVAMSYAMYTPVAADDHEQIVRLLDFFKHVYRIVAAVIILLGILLLPFLPFLVKGAGMLTIRELRLYFLVFLSNTVISYFVSYRYCYIHALQKNYIETNINIVLNFVTVALQIAVVLIWKDFLAYLLVYTGMLIISRAIIYCYLNRRFPILKEKPGAPLSGQEKQRFISEARGLAVHKFASVAVHQTDNIIISSLTELGIVAVGFVSNYNLIMKTVVGFIQQIFGSVTSGFGNLVAASTRDNYRKVFLTANFLSFWIYGFCSIAFFVLIPPFITLWIGSDKLIDSGSFLLIVINCYFQGQCEVFNNARNAIGNFGMDKRWALLQAAVNLVVSVIGAKTIGLIGVYVGTVASRLVYVIFRPYAAYKAMFRVSSREYYYSLIRYFLAVSVAGFLTYLATVKLLSSVTVLRFLISLPIVALIPNLVFAVLFCRSTEFKDALDRARKLAGRRSNE